MEPRKSALEEDFEEEEEKEENDQVNGLDDEAHEKDYYRGRSPERERDRDRRRDRDRYRYLCLFVVYDLLFLRHGTHFFFLSYKVPI